MTRHYTGTDLDDMADLRAADRWRRSNPPASSFHPNDPDRPDDPEDDEEGELA
jgi:hypothetical protein